MLNKKGQRELAYVVKVKEVLPIDGADNVELVVINGWRVMVKKNEFRAGDYAVYFEVDSKLPEAEPFLFLAAKKYRIKTQKYFKGTVFSQGLILSFNDFCVNGDKPRWLVKIEKEIEKGNDVENTFLTDEIGVTYYSAEDNSRKQNKTNQYEVMVQHHANLFKYTPFKQMMCYKAGRKFLFFFFGKKKQDNKKAFPAHFPYIKKTDQERCENMPWVLEDKTPFIKTTKCDGSSATYILEKKRFNNYEFYVCSRNVRMLDKSQGCYHGTRNYYWEIAEKYDIEKKMRNYLSKHPELNYVCWQGELCGPAIQANPHKLKEYHLYLFHMIDSSIGKYDIRDAKKIWDFYDMESVSILDENYVLPDTMEEFKLTADGYYPPEVCEGNKKCKQEGYVYYKTTDPNFSFKNVSRQYLLKHQN